VQGWPPGLPNNPDANYTANKRPSDCVLGTTSRSTGATIVNSRMSQVFTAMKAQGIVVCTITFQLSNTTNQDLYRSCTTSPAHFFNSCSNNDLKNAFEANRQQAG
jgi:hypothetical protein